MCKTCRTTIGERRWRAPEPLPAWTGELPARQFGHACVRIEHEGHVVVLDPGVFTEPEAVDGATAVLVGLAAQGPALPLLAVGSVAGIGVGATAVHRILAPEPDLTEPPVETPFGPLPRAQLAGYGRGLLVVLLLAAGPALVVALPQLWLPALTAVVVLALAALALAATTGGRI